jgi:hypothetical protein
MKRLPSLKLFDIKRLNRLFKTKNGHLKPNLVFATALLSYIILAILLFKYYQYIITTDGVSYISIANEYAIGDFSDAINGYWSPLFSWLLAPFLSFGTTKMYLIHSGRILSLIIGFFTLIGVKFLFSKFITNKNIKNIAIFSMVPVVLYFALYLITPDLLIACVLLFYFGLIFDPKYSFHLRNGFACGFLGALAYFSKTFAFVFFIFHFIIFNIFFYFKAVDDEKKKKVKRNLILGLTVFLALSGIWIGLISDKYDKVTIGTSGTYNQAFVGPDSQGHPLNGLIVPPNKNAVSGWEDPSYFNIKPWNPLGSIKSIIFELNIIWNNIIKTSTKFLSFSILSLFILLAALIFVLKYKKDEVSKRNLMYLLVTIFIYSGGYCLIFVDTRYLWVISILIFLLGVYLFEVLFKNGLIKSKIRNILLILLILSTFIMPVTELNDNINVDENIHNISYDLQYNYHVHGNLASKNEWVLSLILTYYLDGKYYGQTKNDSNLNELETELKNNNIDYYLVWGKSNQTDLPYQEITGGKIDILKVYYIKNKI